MLDSRLFQPITVNGMELKNRILMPAMHHLYTEDGYCTDRFANYYYRRAEGGAGLVIVGSCRFDDYGAKRNSMSLRTDDTIPGWRVFTDGMHQRGCKVAVQLYHAGRYMPKRDVPCGGDALAPSPVYCPYTKETPPEMTRAQIGEVIANWAAGAVRAQKAGFDAVEIIASAGYLIPQFLSPVTNRRTDEYGGSWENRCRFPLEVIRAVRAAVGPDYPVFLRLGGSDFIEGSNTNADMAAFAPLAQEAGADLLNVTVGWHESRVPMITGDVPPGGLAWLGRAIKAAVTIPVAIGGRINTPAAAEKALALGFGDLVALGRPLLADPDFPNKAREGRDRLIRPCMGCNQGCLAGTFFDQPVQCLVNPVCGREGVLRTVRTSAPKRILVVGGGPAGCETALRAAWRGHTVALWEKDPALGGQLRLNEAVPARQEFARLLRYYAAALEQAGVEVALNKTASPLSIQRGGFDVVVLATGGASTITRLPVKEGAPPVYTSTQVLSGDAVPGRNVVVIGGSYVGCFTAQALARQGALSPEQLFHLTVHRAESPEHIARMLNTSERTVSIVEKGPKIGFGFEPGTGWPVLGDLARLKVKKYPNTTVAEIGPGGVLCEGADEEGEPVSRILPCDAVVVASGVHPDDGLKQALARRGVNAVCVGNAARLGKAMEAIHAAAELAVTL